MLFLCDIFETEGLQPITVSVTFALFKGYRTLEMIQFWSLFECWTECLPILCIIFVLLNTPSPQSSPPLTPCCTIFVALHLHDSACQHLVHIRLVFIHTFKWMAYSKIINNFLCFKGGHLNGT